jgi:hypothetical protein
MREPFLVDGYWIFDFITRYNGMVINGWLDLDFLPIDISGGDLYWMTGKISIDVEHLFGQLRSITIFFDIDSIEQCRNDSSSGNESLDNGQLARGGTSSGVEAPNQNAGGFDVVWITSGTENVLISVPPTWNYEHGNWGSLSLFGEGTFDSIHMRVGEFMTETDVLDSTGRFMEVVNDADSSREFVFDDGYIGFMLEYTTFISWVRDDTWMQLNFLHGGARSHFVNNEELVLRIAGSFTTD